MSSEISNSIYRSNHAPISHWIILIISYPVLIMSWGYIALLLISEFSIGILSMFFLMLVILVVWPFLLIQPDFDIYIESISITRNPIFFWMKSPLRVLMFSDIQSYQVAGNTIIATLKSGERVGIFSRLEGRKILVKQLEENNILAAN